MTNEKKGTDEEIAREIEYQLDLAEAEDAKQSRIAAIQKALDAEIANAHKETAGLRALLADKEREIAELKAALEVSRDLLDYYAEIMNME